MVALIAGILLLLATIMGLGLMIDSGIAVLAAVGYVLAAVVVITALWALTQIVKAVKN